MDDKKRKRSVRFSPGTRDANHIRDELERAHLKVKRLRKELESQDDVRFQRRMTEDAARKSRLLTFHHWMIGSLPAIFASTKMVEDYDRQHELEEDLRATLKLLHDVTAAIEPSDDDGGRFLGHELAIHQTPEHCIELRSPRHEKAYVRRAPDKRKPTQHVVRLASTLAESGISLAWICRQLQATGQPRPRTLSVSVDLTQDEDEDEDEDAEEEKEEQTLESLSLHLRKLSKRIEALEKGGAEAKMPPEVDELRKMWLSRVNALGVTGPGNMMGVEVRSGTWETDPARKRPRSPPGISVFEEPLPPPPPTFIPGITTPAVGAIDPFPVSIPAVGVPGPPPAAIPAVGVPGPPPAAIPAVVTRRLPGKLVGTSEGRGRKLVHDLTGILGPTTKE